MNWEAIITIVVSAVSPFVATFGTKAVESSGAKLGESVVGEIQKLWKWIHQSVETGDQEDKKLLDAFQREPVKHQNQLKRTLLNLTREEDPALRELTRNLYQELVRLLDNPENFTLSDLKRICSYVDTHWEDEVAFPTKEALVRWVINHAQARHDIKTLIDAIKTIKTTIF